MQRSKLNQTFKQKKFVLELKNSLRKFRKKEWERRRVLIKFLKKKVFLFFPFTLSYLLILSMIRYS